MKPVLYSSVALTALTVISVGGLSASAQSDTVSIPSDRLVAHSTAATAQWGNLETFWGNLETFWGNLETFEGENTASWGNLETFWGNLETFWGNLETFHGDVDSYWGNLETFWGNLETFEGENGAMWGNLETFWGNLETFEGSEVPFWGNLETFWGNLETFEGDASASWGNLETFWGNLETFHNEMVSYEGDFSEYSGSLDSNWGNLETFWGNLETFNGNLDSKWGNLETFWGNLETFEGDLSNHWGNLETFWGNLETFWGNLETFWGNLETFEGSEAEYAELLSQLGTFYNMSQDQFAIPVALIEHQDFYEGFAKDVFAKYGIDPTDASTLADLDAIDRVKFFVDWYDGLMLYTGIDRVDSWMTEVNWSPALTQDHSYNTQAVIGLLDFGVTDETLFSHNVVYSGGYETDEEDAHGSAVVSLMIAPHDGWGIMGIAPNAGVAIYNPFDETNTAGWEDVSTGIETLIDEGARVINMSLGAPGTVLSDDWSSILSGVVADPASEGAIFVKAAGNEGAVQGENVAWDSREALERLILVGATGVDGSIASWSNTPGEACATFGGSCTESDKLKYQYLVAPGEFILVSDGQGGVMRQAGTSFAAPLVSGTAALVHGAWPWWKSHGEETVDVILQSATDLGEEGVDGVYGWGMLNVEGALSPLNWDDMKFFYSKSADGRLRRAKSADWISNTYLKANKIRLEDNGAYLVALEYVGDTFRDFRIPLSTQLFGQVNVLDRVEHDRKFQRHLYQRFVDWASGGASFGDVQSYEAPLGLNGDWSLSMFAAPITPGMDVREGELPFQTDVVLRQTASGASIRFGHGDGAARLNSSEVFGFYSDFNSDTGGVNPILGLASGGTYIASTVPLSERLSVTASMSEASDDHSYIDPLTEIRVYDENGLADFGATAANISVNYELIDNLNLSLDYTQLRERDSLLGDQGTGFLSMNGGSVTDAVTFGSEVSLPFGLAVGASATMAETRSTTFDNGFLSISDGGLNSTAFAVGLRKNGIVGKRDTLRLSLAQPLRVESGSFEFSALEVVNRETGELGLVNQVWGLQEVERELNLEISYGTPILSGMGEISAFSRTDLNATVANNPLDPEYAAGGRIAIRF